jgi:hypothetical protein
MNWEAISAIGQIVGAVLVGITLIYLALQLRQNTASLRSSTFQAISTTMGLTMEILTTHPDLAPLLMKAHAGLDVLAPVERVRFGFLKMMAMRRVETVVVQRHFGFIEPEFTAGFERSALSVMAMPGAREWWATSRAAFSDLFARWLDEQIAANPQPPMHAGLGLPVREASAAQTI